MHRASKILITISAMVLALAVSDVAFAQCAMCKTGLLNSPEGQQMAHGFNTGILFLLSVPFVIVGAMTLWLLCAHRRSRRATASRMEPWMTYDASLQYDEPS